MSGFPFRPVETWTSSRVSEIADFTGAFVYDVTPTAMVTRSIEHIRSLFSSDLSAYSPGLQSFIRGSLYQDKLGPQVLIAYASFKSGDDLHSVNFSDLEDRLSELELHFDINFTFGKVTYCVDFGSGPVEPLKVYQRRPFTRGVGFRLHESEAVNASMASGQIAWPENTRLAQIHYSTGLGLLAGEDGISGLLDGAFMQFYLAIECALGTMALGKVRDKGRMRFGERFTDRHFEITKHVYLARHHFFGHGHPKLEGRLRDRERSFAVAKQVLVAKWCARELISLLVDRNLLNRTTALYSLDRQGSASFHGELSDLDKEFALPV